MSDVEVEALKPFNRTPQGDLCEAGDIFPVTETRADELARLGLARRTDGKKVEPETGKKVMPARLTKSVKLGG